MSISENIQIVKENIDQAAKRSGRSSEEIKLIAVSKTKPVSDIIEAFDSGIFVFGENYAQEASTKISEVHSINNKIKFHFIGHLQSNKIKLIAKIVNCIQTIDSLKLATKINEYLVANQLPRLDIMIQVNTSKEFQKSGVGEDNLIELVDGILELEKLNLKGLMTIGSFTENIDIKKSEYSLLKDISAKLNNTGIKLPELSMGMSDDYEIAIEQGATMIRVGSKIFGSRT